MKSRQAFVLSATAGLLIALALFACGPAVPPKTSLSVQGTIPGGTTRASKSVTQNLTRATSLPIEIPVEYPAGTSLGTITLNTVKIVLKEFQIELEGTESDTSETEFNGPYVVDLVNGTIDPTPAAIDLPAGTYDNIKFKIDKIEGDEVDETNVQLVADADPLFGKSILIEGTYTPTSGSPVDFSYSYDIDAEFELSPTGDTATGLVVTDTSATDIIVAFRLNKWFTGIDPAAFAADPAAFGEDIKENIKLSADYGEDEDHDGVLEANEDDDPDVEDSSDY